MLFSGAVDVGLAGFLEISTDAVAIPASKSSVAALAAHLAGFVFAGWPEPSSALLNFQNPHYRD